MRQILLSWGEDIKSENLHLDLAPKHLEKYYLGPDPYPRSLFLEKPFGSSLDWVKIQKEKGFIVYKDKVTTLLLHFNEKN